MDLVDEGYSTHFATDTPALQSLYILYTQLYAPKYNGRYGKVNQMCDNDDKVPSTDANTKRQCQPNTIFLAALSCLVALIGDQSMSIVHFEHK